MSQNLNPARPSRRQFLGQTSLGLAGMMLGPASGGMAVGVVTSRRLRVAAVVTEFTYRSHAHVILENFLGPYLFNGKKTDPGMDVVGLYVDQFPESRPGAGRRRGSTASRSFRRSRRHCGRRRPAGGRRGPVDRRTRPYPKNAKAQTRIPRKRFFDEIVAEFARSGKRRPGLQRQASVLSGRLGS